MEKELDIFFTPPEISEWCSDSQLSEKYGITNIDNGWYELTNGDFALVITRHGKNKVFVWVRLDVRDELEKILDLPTLKRN